MSEDPLNYKNRRLKNGPSGSELQTTAANSEMENRDREGVEKNIKVTVTLASRDKKQRLTKKINSKKIVSCHFEFFFFNIK